MRTVCTALILLLSPWSATAGVLVTNFNCALAYAAPALAGTLPAAVAPAVPTTATTAPVARVARPELPPVRIELPPPVDLDTMDRSQWAGSVSTAREAMRLVQGPLSPDEERRFERRWASYLEFPNREVVEYFNRLNPLLAHFLACRRAVGESLLALDRAQLEAAHLTAYRDATGLVECMRGVALLHAHLRGIEATMTEVVHAIEALGEPPDAAAAQAEARRRHRNAMNLFAGDGSSAGPRWAVN